MKRSKLDRKPNKRYSTRRSGISKPSIAPGLGQSSYDPDLDNFTTLEVRSPSLIESDFLREQAAKYQIDGKAPPERYCQGGPSSIKGDWPDNDPKTKEMIMRDFPVVHGP